MITPKAGEIVKYMRDGNLFKVKKITDDFVILEALNGLTQIFTGKSGFDLVFEGSAPGFSGPAYTPGQAPAG